MRDSKSKKRPNPTMTFQPTAKIREKVEIALRAFPKNKRRGEKSNLINKVLEHGMGDDGMDLVIMAAEKRIDELRAVQAMMKRIAASSELRSSESGEDSGGILREVDSSPKPSPGDRR